MEGLFNDDDLELSKTAQKLRHSRKTITGREVSLGQWGLYEHETLDYLNMDSRYGHWWHELLILIYFCSKMKQIWHVSREVTLSLMTILSGLKVIICVMRVFLSIDMLRCGSNHVLALQPVYPMVERCCFHHPN